MSDVQAIPSHHNPCGVRHVLPKHRAAASCILNVSFGCDTSAQGRIWVAAGCAGDFSCGQKAKFCGQPTRSTAKAYCDCLPLQPQQDPMVSCWRDPAMIGHVRSKGHHGSEAQRCQKKDARLLWPSGQRSSPRHEQRIAVCLVGTARTFSNCEVHESIRKHFISVFARKATVDVFAVLALQDAETKRQAGFVRGPAPSARPETVMASLSRLWPRAVELFHRGPDPERNPFCPLQGALDGQLGERALAQFMKFSRCLNLIEAAEALDGKAYHRVVRTRPDLLWSRNHISVDLMKPEATIFSKYPDQHFVLPRVAADYLMRVYERYQRCNQSDRKDILFQQYRAMESLIVQSTKEAVAAQGGARVNFTAPYVHTGWPGLWEPPGSPSTGSLQRFFSVARPADDPGDRFHKPHQTKAAMAPGTWTCCNYSDVIASTPCEPRLII